MLRSEHMGYYSIAMPREDAWDIMNELGELSMVQFVDLHEKEQILARPYTSYIKRLEEMEMKVQTMEQLATRFNINVEKCTEYKAFLKSQRELLKKRNKAENTYIYDVENDMDERLKNLSDQIKYYDASVEAHNNHVEHIRVLGEAQIYFAEDEKELYPEVKPGEEYKLTSAQGGVATTLRSIKFQYLAGVIDREDAQRFRRVLFRATLGMVWSNLIDIEPKPPSKKRDHHHFVANSKNEQKKKTIFLIAYPTGEQGILKAKLDKIADSFGANKYEIPMDKQNFMKKLEELKVQREDEEKVLRATREHIEMLIEDLINPETLNGTWSRIEEYRLFVRKETSLYRNLGYFWCPLENEETVRKTLENLPTIKPNVAQPKVAFQEKPETALPPTHFRTNDFTAPFQEIVNTYGVPRYQEVNPGLFTIATFPFLFGVMFGDIGHGLILFILGLYLCFNKNEIQKEKGGLLKSVLSARYLLAMMGFFAFYCGFIYNDFMALPLNLFGSCYEESTDGTTYARTSDTCVYSFGLDPAWYKSTNELTFFNSFKMKMAIIIGVSQMTLGVMLKALNNIHFGSWLDFFFEWIPQILFLSCTFGYMVVLIFIKWATPYGVTIPTSEAPAIITIFINFVLSFGKFDIGTAPNVVRPIYGNEDGSTETTVQRVLLIIAIITIPWMLLPKPLTLIIVYYKKQTIKTAYALQEAERAYDELRAAEDEVLDQEKDLKLLRVEDYQLNEETAPLKGTSKDETLDESRVETEIKERVKAESKRKVEEKKTSEDKGKSQEKDLEEGRKGRGDIFDKAERLDKDEAEKKEEERKEKEPPKKGDAKKRKPDVEAHREEGPQEESPGDIFVHQIIETIEFVLGSVSHTASYLRLWALSLAHSQLAAVFFTYTIGTGISDGNFFLAFFGYTLFALITFGVLLCMDLLECFLHALRLHWVEFQSKFYKADGKGFEPFSYESSMDAEKKV